MKKRICEKDPVQNPVQNSAKNSLKQLTRNSLGCVIIKMSTIREIVDV
jgi:hypothetical protein